MAELKTKPTKQSVSGFLKTVTDPERRADCQVLVELMRSVTNEEPRMWGPSIVGFGSYIYLLKHAGPARSSTSAFVNPLIAVALGAAVAGEPIGPRTVAAAAMIIAAVAGVILGTARR